MRRFIFASHHKLASGLKDSVSFLTNYTKEIYDINAYLDDEAEDIEITIKKIFENFGADDEVLVLVDILGGSVFQKFYPYLNDHVHLICGMNLPLAMSLLLYPEDCFITKEEINKIVDECKNQLIYVNDMQVSTDLDDE